jgi:hypothetical protein
VRSAPAWRVEVEPHGVARWSIEAAVVEVRAASEVQARIAATREVHRRTGVPGWRPWLRQTYVRTRVLERLNDGAKRESNSRRAGAIRSGISSIETPGAPPAARADCVSTPIERSR